MRAGIASKQNIYPHKVNNKLIVRRFQSKGIEAREIVPPYQQTNNFDKDGFDIVGVSPPAPDAPVLATAFFTLLIKAIP